MVDNKEDCFGLIVDFFGIKEYIWVFVILFCGLRFLEIYQSSPGHSSGDSEEDPPEPHAVFSIDDTGEIGELNVTSLAGKCTAIEKFCKEGNFTKENFYQRKEKFYKGKKCLCKEENFFQKKLFVKKA